MTVKNERNVSFKKFTGLNIKDAPSLVKDTDLTELTNLVVASGGNLEKRRGIDNAGQQTMDNNEIRLLGQFVTATYNHVLASTPTSLYYSNDNGTSWILIGALAQGVYATQYLDKFYIVTLANGIRKWDGTALTSVAGSPSGSHIISFKDRLWVCGDNSTLYYSSPGTSADTWPANNLLRVSPGDGDRLVMSIPFSDRLILFKTRTSWNLYLSGEPSAWALRVLNTEHGCTSPYGADEIDNLVYLISYDGVYRTDGVVFREVSSSIRPAFRNRPFQFSFYQEDTLSYVRDYVYVTIKSLDGYQTYIFSVDTQAWALFQTKFTVSLGRQLLVTSTLGQQRILSGVRTGGTARVLEFKENFWSDMDQSIRCSFKTKRNDFDTLARMIRGKVLNVIMEGTSATPEIGYYWDGNKMTVVDVNDITVDHLASYKMAGPGYFRALEIYFIDDTISYLSIIEMDLRLSIKRSLLMEET